MLNNQLALTERSAKKGSTLANPSQSLINMLTKGVNGSNVTMTTAHHITAVRKCLTVIGDGMATMSLNLYKLNGLDKEMVDYPVLYDPNDFQTEFSFRKYMYVRMAYRGNSIAFIGRNFDGSPKGVIPIHCGYRLELVKGELYYVLMGHEPFGLPRVVNATDVLHFKGLCIDNMLNGVNPIVAHAKQLKLNMTTYSSLENTYKTGAKKFLLKSQKAWDTTKQDQVKQSIEDVLKGVDNTAAVPAGVDIEQISLSPAEAGYLEAIGATEHDIALMFNVPPSMVVRESSLKTARGSATVEQERIKLRETTLLPISREVESEMRRKYLTPSMQKNHKFVHEFNSLLRATAAEKAEYYARAINNGWMTINEVRRLENLPAVENGDELYINAANIPASKILEWIESKINKNNSKTNKDNNPEGNNDD